MRIAIRADASPRIGSGHVMRCLALADILRGQGASIRLLCRHMPEGLARMVREKGHEVALLPPAIDAYAERENDPPHAAWLGTAWERDAEDSLKALGDVPGWDWLIIDHYALDARWTGQLRQAAHRILMIDDLADRPLDCDLLLDQNLQPSPEERYRSALAAPTRCLLGPSYALLRSEFAELAATTKPRDGKVSQLLIALGGADSGNVTQFLTECVLEIADPALAITVVVGDMHPAKGALRTLLADRPSTGLVVDTREMARLMADSDLAIGAGGSMNWERMCLGLPAVLVALELNQEVTSAYLGEQGLVIYLGRADGLDRAAIIDTLKPTLAGGAYLQRQSREGMVLVDGHGAERVTAEMAALSRA